MKTKKELKSSRIFRKISIGCFRLMAASPLIGAFLILVWIFIVVVYKFYLALINH